MKSILKKPEEEFKVEEIPEVTSNATEPINDTPDAVKKLNLWLLKSLRTSSISTQTTNVKVMTCTKKTQTDGCWINEMLALDAMV